MESLHDEGESKWFYVDDNTGKVLGKKEVEDARRLEMKTFKDIGVYEYVKREIAVKDSSGKLVGVRWVDVDKGKEIRSRLVAQEFASEEEREDLFAATPPLAATKFVISDAASKGNGIGGEYKLMVMDIKRAFLYGDIDEVIYIELPDEDPMKAKGCVGKLIKAMYGTRAAPSV